MTRRAARLIVVLASALLLTAPSSGADAPAPGARMAGAARAFLATLPPAAAAKAKLPFGAPERHDWGYVPKSRAGLALKAMDPAQREAALALLAAGLSEKGYAKVETIRGLEDVLAGLEGSSFRDPGLYTVVVFGEPAESGTWGLRYEGHHVSLNWTFVSGRSIASTPQFLGANPAEVKDGPRKGTRALAAEEDLARSFVKSLEPERLRSAVVSASAPADILTGSSRRAATQGDRGLAWDAMTAPEQAQLLRLLEEHAGAQRPEIAAARMERLRAAGLPTIRFAWMGGLEKGQGHYYRIQGATFLVEYDNTQNGANHVHSVWRDFDGDFGEDLLAAHYGSAPHASGTSEAANAAPALRVTLLGTGNPRPVPERYGPSILVEAATTPPTRILVDAGRGAAERLFTLGGRGSLSGIDLVLLTHLHSDHVVGLPDVWLTGWLFGRARPFSLKGPGGSAALMSHLEKAYEFDVKTRRDIDEGLPGNGAVVDARDVPPDTPFEVSGVRITPFLVDHRPVKPAYGYRIDYAGKSVVLSGDTRYSENLIAHARGCDVLIHEVVAPDVERRASLMREPAVTQRIIDHHTTPEDAGRIFTAVKPKLAVYSHIVPSPTTARDLEVPTRRTYAGPLLVGEDLSVVDVGETVTFHSGRNP